MNLKTLTAKELRTIISQLNNSLREYEEEYHNRFDHLYFYLDPADLREFEKWADDNAKNILTVSWSGKLGYIGQTHLKIVKGKLDLVVHRINTSKYAYAL